MDDVVPFLGSSESLGSLRRRLATLSLRDGDSVLVVDNTPGPPREGTLHAPEIPTPAYARNRGAALGQAEWLVFIDSDADPPPDLLDRYFSPSGRPDRADRGRREDEEAPPGSSMVTRYAYLRGAMSQDDTFDFGEWGYPKTANVACRRAAFEQVGGFRDEARAAEDADLTYRLRAAGWDVERREDAAVVHASRTTLRGFLVQKAVWGGAALGCTRSTPGRSRSWVVPGSHDGRYAPRWAAWSTPPGAGSRRGPTRRVPAARGTGLGVREALLPNLRPVPDSSPWKRLGLIR